MSELTAKEIANKLDRTAQEINATLCEIGFIKKFGKGYTLCELGKENGGLQAKYMGNDFVKWSERILQNQIFLKSLLSSEQEQSEEEKSFRQKFQATIRTKSGHFVRSRAEQIIADYLFNAFVPFAYERKLPVDKDAYCDFFIPRYNIYIEFWGLENDEKYKKRKVIKQEIYKKYSFNLIEINDEKLKNLDDFLPNELRKFGLIIE